MKRNIILSFLAIIAWTGMYGQAAETKPKPIEQAINKLQLAGEFFYPVSVFQNPDNAIEESMGPYVKLTADKQRIAEVFKANYKSIRLEIPLPGNKSVNVLLTQHKIHTEDFQLTITNASGTQPVSMNAGRYYYGIIENGTNTLAAISIFENEINGVLSNAQGNWNLGQRKNMGDNYVYYNDHEFKLPLSFECGTVDTQDHSTEKGGGSSSTFATQYKGNCAKIFIDCGNNYYIQQGSNGTNVTNYTNSIFNVMQTIYANDSIEIINSGIHIWATIDPFNDTNTSTALSTFSTWWTGNGGWSGSIAAYFNTGLGGGLAYVDVICSAGNQYNVCGIIGSGLNSFPTYSWDAYVTSHECGHNFGSPHTHWCGWVGGAIDNCNTYWGSNTQGGPQSNSCAGFNFPLGTEGGCANGPSPSNGGTIMSYCHGCSAIGINFSNGFGFQPSTKIRNRIAAASCINVCTACNTNLAFSNATHFTGQNQSWWATNQITCTHVNQQSGSYLNFNAGVEVILYPNFEVVQGAVFHASAGCTPLALPQGNNSMSARAYQVNSPQGVNELQVFPNPFANQLKAAFELTYTATVTATIVDQLGREIPNMQFARELQQGHHEINLNTEQLVPGIYYLIVQIDGVQLNKKIIKM